MIKESQAVAKLLLKKSSQKEWIEVIIKQNILQKRSDVICQLISSFTGILMGVTLWRLMGFYTLSPIMIVLESWVRKGLTILSLPTYKPSMEKR